MKALPTPREQEIEPLLHYIVMFYVHELLFLNKLSILLTFVLLKRPKCLMHPKTLEKVYVSLQHIFPAK